MTWLSRSVLIVAALGVATVASADAPKKKGKGGEAAPPPAAAAAPAEEAPAPGVVDYRDALFHGFGSHMKSMGLIAKGKVDRPAGDLAVHAAAIAEGAGLIADLFPEGSGPDATKTRALPAVWTDAEGFAKAADVLRDEAAKLAEIARTGDLDAAKAQLGNVGKACGSCHELFRAEEH